MNTRTKPNSTAQIFLICLSIVGVSCKDDNVVSPDPKPAPLEKQFVFPSAIGNTWTYRWDSRQVGHDFSGTHTWTIFGRDSSGAYLMMDVRHDSITSEHPPVFTIDTAYFSLVIQSDFITINFPEWFRGFTETIRIPATSTTQSDTVVIRTSRTQNATNFEYATYLSGLGLLAYDSEVGSTMSRYSSRLKLLSYDVK